MADPDRLALRPVLGTLRDSQADLASGRTEDFTAYLATARERVRRIAAAIETEAEPMPHGG